MDNHVEHMDAVAIRKSGVAGWEPYEWERIGNDLMITGSVPRLLTRGPRKGQKTFDGKGTKVVVTREEVDQEMARYAAETGNCPECFGEGEVLKSWHVDHGTTMRECPKCKGSRRVTPAESAPSSQS